MTTLWAAETKQSAEVLSLLAASMVLADLMPTITRTPGSPPHAIAEQALIQAIALLRAKREADIRRSRDWDHLATRMPLQPAQSLTLSQSLISVFDLLGLLKVLGLGLPFLRGLWLQVKKILISVLMLYWIILAGKDLIPLLLPFYVIFLYHWGKLKKKGKKKPACISLLLFYCIFFLLFYIIPIKFSPVFGKATKR